MPSVTIHDLHEASKSVGVMDTPLWPSAREPVRYRLFDGEEGNLVKPAGNAWER